MDFDVTDFLRGLFEEETVAMTDEPSAPLLTEEKDLPAACTVSDDRKAASRTQRSDTATPAGLPDQKPDKCYWCRRSVFWRSIYRRVICANCHPPAVPSLVAEWIGGDQNPGTDGHGSRPASFASGREKE